LEDGILAVGPSDHFANEEDARAAIEPFLRAWEIDADLRLGVGAIRFTSTRSEILDRDPPPPGTPQSLAISAAARGMAVASASLHITRGVYPQPPARFQITADVAIAHRRWLRYHDGREPLQSMAYFVLTLLEDMAGGRGQAGRVFAIDVAVLKTMGRLSAEGDEETARKLQRGKALRGLTGAEKDWLEQAVKLLIRRIGERASGSPLGRLTLNDLPNV